MQPSAERPFCLEDYLPFLKSLADSEDESVLVGGLAVSAWAELFLDESERHHFDLPIFSKDIDLRGRKMTCLALTKLMQLNGAILGGVVSATRKNAPHMGRVFAASITWRNFKTSVEVLERLKPLRPGAHCLVIGAAGGVGTYVTQLARFQGATVTAVCSQANAAWVTDRARAISGPTRRRPCFRTAISST